MSCGVYGDQLIAFEGQAAVKVVRGYSAMSQQDDSVVQSVQRATLT